MQLDAVRSIAHLQVDPDPGAVSTVSAGLVFPTKLRQPTSDVPNGVVLLALAAPAAESVTVNLWALREDSAIPVGEEPAAIPSLRFFLLASGVVVPGGTLVARQCYLGGPIYAQVTADTLTTARNLRATCAPPTNAPSTGGIATVVTTTQLPATLGQKTAALSTSVVLASDDHMKGAAGPVALAAASEAANMLPLGQYRAAAPTLTDGQVVVPQLDVNGNKKGVEQLAARGEDNANQVFATASKPVIGSAYAWSRYTTQTALENSKLAKTGAGNVRAISVRVDETCPTQTLFVLVVDAAAVPSSPAGAITRIDGQKRKHVLNTDDVVVFDFPGTSGQPFTNGLCVLLSTNEFTYTAIGAYLSMIVEYV